MKFLDRLSALKPGSGLKARKANPGADENELVTRQLYETPGKASGRPVVVSGLSPVLAQGETC